MGYNPIEPQSDEDFERIHKTPQEKEVLVPCLSWSVECCSCNAIYNSQISKKHPLISFSIDNFDKDCKGLSNKSRCLAFKGIKLSAREQKFKEMKELESLSSENILVIERRKVF